MAGGLNMPQVSVDLVRVICRETEDSGWFGSADEFYISGLVQAGEAGRSVLTRPLKIDNGQTRDFPQGRVFEGLVPDGFPVRFALEAYDQDHDGKWNRRIKNIGKASSRMENAGKQNLPPTITGSTDPTSINAKKLLQDIRNSWENILSIDDDDLLGTLAWNVPVTNNRLLTESTYSWHLTRDDADYVVNYQLTAIRDGATARDIEEERARLRKLRQIVHFLRTKAQSQFMLAGFGQPAT